MISLVRNNRIPWWWIMEYENYLNESILKMTQEKKIEKEIKELGK